MNDIQRIDENGLDWDGDTSILDGMPYSGVAFLLYQNGSLKREVTYQNGFEEGICQEWYPNGNLKRKWIAERGRAQGRIEEWYAVGTVKSISEFDFGVELQYKEWDMSGKLIAVRQIDENSESFKYLQHMQESRIGGREAESGPEKGAG
jgi:antitoxin component YwqK of YwqJK toxin-antitoxin module